METLKHVLHISTPVTWRGGEQQLYYLVEGSKKFKHTVLCPENSVLAERLKALPHIELLHFDNSSFFTRWLSIQKAVTLPQFSFDILHTHDAKAHSLALYALMATGKKTPLIVHRRVDFAIRRNVIKAFKYTHHLVSRVVSVSKAIDAMVAQQLPNHKRAVVYSGVDIDAIHSEPKDIRENLELDPSTFLFVNVAALAPHKDQITLIKAFALFLDQVENKSNIRLLIAGEGKSRAGVEDAVRSLNLNSNVILMGYRNDVKEWLASSDVFVISSETEGLGTSIIDAMAAKLPIVATAAGGIVELINDGENGLLTPVRDHESMAEKLNVIYRDATLRSKLSANAYGRATDFSQVKMVEGIESLYRTVLSEGIAVNNKV